MRIPDHSSDSAPLLALVNATAEWHAGLSGACRASVRLLDRVHFTVYRGDCVVVHHDDPASARVLLAALSGHEVLPAQRRLQGYRHCAPGVRIRRCSIPVGAVSALQAGWQQLDTTLAPVPLSSSHVFRDSVVHLMRASRYTVTTGYERAQWKGWACRVRASGGALVVVAPGTLQPAAMAAELPGDRTAVGTTLRERQATGYTLPERSASCTQAMWLHHGRLCNLRTWE
jgi:hypothetical protein